MDPRSFGPSISYYQDPVTQQIADPRRESSASPALQSYSVQALQCALAARGVAITVDGYYGPQTRTYLDSALRGYKLEASASVEVQAADFERNARTNATTLRVSQNFAEWLFRRAPQCRTSTPSTTRSPRPPRTSSSSITETTFALPFWRKDNWKAWAVVLGGAVVVGGVGFYGYKKRWFR